ncbi:MAG: zinc ribbon domain-containing protein [Christensenellales bacterium]|nr:zinc ribbon domain-containing protein [Christensenellales bacterium]
MPLYEYQCASCGHQFEVLRSIKERDGVLCEKCGKPVERVYRGKCAFGTPKGSCSGHCSRCSGCSGGHGG